MRIIGVRYTELDRIEAQIEEYLALLETTQGFKPSPELKKLYREVAKKIHPDLATDEDERKRRQDLMAEANIAYENGNIEKLKSILHNWQNSPESVKGEGISFELIRIIRQIAQSRDRLKAIQLEIAALEQTELFQLKTKVTEANQVGQDLLADMASEFVLRVYLLNIAFGTPRLAIIIFSPNSTFSINFDRLVLVVNES